MCATLQVSNTTKRSRESSSPILHAHRHTERRRCVVHIIYDHSDPTAEGINTQPFQGKTHNIFSLFHHCVSFALITSFIPFPLFRTFTHWNYVQTSARIVEVSDSISRISLVGVKHSKLTAQLDITSHKISLAKDAISKSDAARVRPTP